MIDYCFMDSVKTVLFQIKEVPYPNAVFAVFLGVKESCLPSQIGHKVFFLPCTDNGKGQTGPLFIALSPKEDVGRAPEGSRAMTVFHYTPSRLEQGNRIFKNKEQMQERVINVLKD